MAEKRANGDSMPELGSTEREPPTPPSVPHLLIVAADGTWTSRSLPTEGVLTIGRGLEADVHLDESAVSRRHARLEVIGAGGLRLVDLDSANGTLVGGTLVRDVAVTLRPGEPVLIGHTLLTVHVPSPSDRGALPSPQRGLARSRVDELISKAAPTLVGVLLLGETGVGKGVIAERIHRKSTRANGPLVQLNCAALSAALLESELFGHVRGAFTDAKENKPGLLETAAGGTVFLDEVGDMPLEVQAKLLVAIEQRVTRRVGDNRTRPIDVRFICATNKDLEAEIRRDRFRADFYYRISQFSIHIPPLRERLDEIDGLVVQFARDAAALLKREQPPVFDEDARARLHCHGWPGNIRELRNLVERAVLLAEGQEVTSSILAAAGLPDHVMQPAVGSAEAADRDRVMEVLAACGFNQSRAALKLGMSRNTLLRRMRMYGIKGPRSMDERSRGTPHNGSSKDGRS